MKPAKSTGRRRKRSSRRRTARGRGSPPATQAQVQRWLVAACACTLAGLALLGTGAAQGKESSTTSAALHVVGAVLTLAGTIGLMYSIHRFGRLGRESPP